MEKQADFKVSVLRGGKDWSEDSFEDVNLIFLDLDMSIFSSMDVCRILKQGEKTKSIPIILLAKNPADAPISACLNLGADDFLVKTYGEDEVLQRVKIHLERSASRFFLEQFSFF